MKQKRHYRKWTDDDLREAVKSSTSVAQVLRKIGLRPTGGNYRSMENNCLKLQLDLSHFKGQGWSKDRFLKKVEEYKCGGKNSKRQLLLIRSHQCEICNRKTWNKNPIPIEIHHIDGNRHNGKDINLQLICPNCHAQTSNYKNKKR